MRIDSAGWPFVLGLAAVALVGGALGGPWWAIPGGAGAAVCLFFFRAPGRIVRAAPGVVVSPADGKVMGAGPPLGRNVPAGQWQQITIFLSPMDVHVNRIPLGGRVS